MTYSPSTPPKPQLPATLTSDSGNVWTFQLNPQSITRTMSARISTVPTINGNRPKVMGTGIEGDKISIADVVAIGVGASDGLDELLLSQSNVLFEWGDRSFGPALLTSLTLTENEWDPQTAEPTLVRISFELSATSA
jgi:hypothetical protein